MAGGQLAGGLHPFGNGLQAQAAGQVDDGGDDGLVIRAVTHVTNKRLVDLEFADVELFQIIQLNQCLAVERPGKCG